MLKGNTLAYLIATTKFTPLAPTNYELYPNLSGAIYTGENNGLSLVLNTDPLGTTLGITNAKGEYLVYNIA